MVDAPENVPHLQYTWEQFDADIEKVARAVEASGQEFTQIYGLPRGGLPMAVCLSHRLEVKLLLNDPLLALADLQEEMGSLAESHLLSDSPTKHIDRAIKNVLVVDDLSDTGKQLQSYKEKGFFIATLHKKPWTKVGPDVWITEETRWIDYPWEKDSVIDSPPEKESL